MIKFADSKPIFENFFLIAFSFVIDRCIALWMRLLSTRSIKFIRTPGNLRSIKNGIGYIQIHRSDLNFGFCKGISMQIHPIWWNRMNLYVNIYDPNMKWDEFVYEKVKGNWVWYRSCQLSSYSYCHLLLEYVSLFWTAYIYLHKLFQTYIISVLYL